MDHILVLNAGSSSLKFALYRAGGTDPEERFSGQVEPIGGPASLRVEATDGSLLGETALPEEDGKTHKGALKAVLSAVGRLAPEAIVCAVGHRVVHGGMTFSAPSRIDHETVSQLETFVPFAPLHQPHNLAGIRAALDAFPEAVQVACFDTAFHRGQPFVHDAFAIPRRYYEAGVRRYGFHGMSYDYITGVLAEEAPELHAGRVVIAHLGNGASMCGVRGGQSIGSSMGFSAVEGLPMGTRSGQLDPGVLLYMLEQEGLTSQEITRVLYKESGLLGLSGVSHDMRTLLGSEDPLAREAVDYFCVHIQGELGRLTAALRGLDGLVFTAGIGENSAAIRERVCAGLGWLGLEIDPEANAQGADVISTPASRVQVRVIPTNEEIVIARSAAALLN